MSGLWKIGENRCTYNLALIILNRFEIQSNGTKKVLGIGYQFYLRLMLDLTWSYYPLVLALRAESLASAQMMTFLALNTILLGNKRMHQILQ